MVRCVVVLYVQYEPWCNWPDDPARPKNTFGNPARPKNPFGGSTRVAKVRQKR